MYFVFKINVSLYYISKQIKNLVMTHNDFNEVSTTFCSNLVASNIANSTRQILTINTQSLNDKKLAKKIEKLAKLMNDANLLAGEIYNQVYRF